MDYHVIEKTFMLMYAKLLNISLTMNLQDKYMSFLDEMKRIQRLPNVPSEITPENVNSIYKTVISYMASRPQDAIWFVRNPIYLDNFLLIIIEARRIFKEQ